MITVHTYPALTAQMEPSIKIELTDRDLLKFQALLNRGLNCAPEFGKDWFELSDRLDQFLLQHHVTK
jgi:hypothetical protein